MRWTQTPEQEVLLRYGSSYWDKRATEQWDSETKGAFGDAEAMKRAHINLKRGLCALGVKKVERIGELGCGWGASYPVIREHYKSPLYLGMDCCTPYIEHAKQQFPSEEFFVGDAMSWLPPLRVDVVVMVATVSSLEAHLPEIIERVFSGWLRPEGRLVIAEEGWFAVFESPL